VRRWLLYMSLLMLIALALPADIFDSQSKHFIFLVGAVGIWRYSMGATHFIRGMIFLYGVYPYLRRKVQKMGTAADPSHVYLMVTSFRIEALTTAQVYSSVIREAINCGFPTTVVCSLVEMSDELLVKSLWARYNPPHTSNWTSCASPVPASATAWPTASAPSRGCCRTRTPWWR
jgi:hypothetical protein